MKKLSILIVNYHSEDYLEKCLESMGEIPRDWEIIIVDNGSKEMLKTQRFKDSKTQVINSAENLGFAKANNQAIKDSSGEYVLLLNPDTVVSQKAIGRMVQFMEEHPKAGIATCRVELPSGELDDASHRGFPTPWNAFCYFSGLSQLFPGSIVFNGYHLGYKNLEKIHEIDACVGAFMLIRRSVGEALQWLDDDYFWYGEDLDFCYRAKLADWKIYYVPDVSILHYKGVSSGIKQHSKQISTADEKTVKRAQQARFDVMKLFYEKHYKDKYPKFMLLFVNAGISLLKRMNE